MDALKVFFQVQYGYFQLNQNQQLLNLLFWKTSVMLISFELHLAQNKSYLVLACSYLRKGIDWNNISVKGTICRSNMNGV